MLLPRHLRCRKDVKWWVSAHQNEAPISSPPFPEWLTFPFSHGLSPTISHFLPWDLALQGSAVPIQGGAVAKGHGSCSAHSALGTENQCLASMLQEASVCSWSIFRASWRAGNSGWRGYHQWTPETDNRQAEGTVMVPGYSASGTSSQCKEKLCFSISQGKNLHECVDKKKEYYDWISWGRFGVGSQESEEALKAQIFPFMLPAGYLEFPVSARPNPSPSACLGSHLNEVADIYWEFLSPKLCATRELLGLMSTCICQTIEVYTQNKYILLCVNFIPVSWLFLRLAGILITDKAGWYTRHSSLCFSLYFWENLKISIIKCKNKQKKMYSLC